MWSGLSFMPQWCRDPGGGMAEPRPGQQWRRWPKWWASSQPCRGSRWPGGTAAGPVRAWDAAENEYGSLIRFLADPHVFWRSARGRDLPRLSRRSVCRLDLLITSRRSAPRSDLPRMSRGSECGRNCSARAGGQRTGRNCSA